MTQTAYITIDDSPSPHSAELISYLEKHDLPAILYCRGDFLESAQNAMAEAIHKNITLANHSFHHKPAGTLSVEEIVEDIEKTEKIIEKIYKKSGISRPGKYYRFPYLDKGNGDRLERRFEEILKNPEIALHEDQKVKELQDYLHKEGFSQPFNNVSHPLYQNEDVKNAADCFFTYSSCDWMLTKRHQGKHPYKSLNDLKKKMDDDPWLCKENGSQILLFHDQPEIETIAIELIDHLRNKNFKFI